MKILMDAGNRFKFSLTLLVVLSLGGYGIGLHWLLPLSMFISIMVAIPMPGVLSSWISRSVGGVLFMYALLQCAEMLQFVLFPAAKFGVLSVIAALLTVVFVWVFGRTEPYRVQILNKKDCVALLMLLPLAISFAPIISGQDSLVRVATIASTQISDSVAHFGGMSGYNITQNLNYSPGNYYPSGFHLTTAYIETAFMGNTNETSWQTHVVIYFGMYLVMAVLLELTLAYVIFFFVEKYSNRSQKRGILGHATAGLIVSLITTPLYLLLFINEGFINYFYICASMLFAFVYILDSEAVYKQNLSIRRLLNQYSWPICAFLLLGFGASFSWPLMALPVLLSGLLLFLLANKTLIPERSQYKTYVLVNLPVAFFVVCNLVAIYFQAKYFKNGSSVINYGGGLTTFNAPLLLIGLLAVAYFLITNLSKSANRVAVVIAPQLMLIAGFMAWQMFKLGEIRYYTIKTAIPLEMTGLLFFVAVIVLLAFGSSLQRLLQPVVAASVALFIVVGTIALVPQPFQEIRGMFRAQTGISLPPHTADDVQILTKLGTGNKIKDFNVTALHYDADNARIYAHEQPALWANAMTPVYTDTSQSISGGRTTNCFGTQYNLLAYGSGTADEQEKLTKAIKQCINKSTKKGLPYYVVTDPPSAVYLRQIFGNIPQYVTD